jgi:hypothetical protein
MRFLGVSLNEGDAIEVSWVDVTGDSGWKTRREVEDFADEPGRYTTVGIFFDLRSGNLVLVQSIAEHPGGYKYDCAVTFPVEVVRKIRKLR